MVIFHSYVSLPEGKIYLLPIHHPPSTGATGHPLVLPAASFAAATEAFRAVLRRDLAARRQGHHGVPGAEIFEGHLKNGAHLAGHGKKLA